MSDISLAELQKTLDGLQRKQFKTTLFHWVAVGIIATCLGWVGLAILEKMFQFGLLGRLILFGSFVMGGLLGWGWEIFHLIHSKQSVRGMAQNIERKLPELEQRLLTSIEYSDHAPSGVSKVLLQQLWQDAQQELKHNDLKVVVPQRAMFLTLGGAALGVLLLIVASWSIPDFARSGLAVLWPWSSPIPQPTLFLTPQDLQVEHGSGLTFKAQAENFDPEGVLLWVQEEKNSWKSISMQRQGTTSQFSHFIPAITDSMVFYVEAKEVQTDQYRITVVEFPAIEQIRFTFVFPPHTGWADETVVGIAEQEVPLGTEVYFSAEATKPLSSGHLDFDNRPSLKLSVDKKLARGSFLVDGDLSFSLEMLDLEGLSPLDKPTFYMRGIADRAPEIAVIQPGRDRQVTALEEVVFQVEANDDYGLQNLQLTYSVAGRIPETYEFFFEGSPQKQEGKTLLYLEDLELEPGDFISYHFSTSDNNPQGGVKTNSEIFFMEVVSTEAEFRKGAQTAGGGGGGGAGAGGGQNSSALTQSQKKIIAATWKLNHPLTPLAEEQFQLDLQVLIDSQNEVLSRAVMSLIRLSERLNLTDDSYDQIVRHMEMAVGHMEQAMDHLVQQDLDEALLSEQSALSELLKAEAQNHLTEIQMAQSGGGAGGGQGSNQQERYDLRELFDMEMGRLENRYELPSAGSNGAEQAQVSQAQRRLEELSRRQERLNREQRLLARSTESEEEKRRRLEKLKRELEKLQQENQRLTQQLSRQSSRARGREQRKQLQALQDQSRALQQQNQSMQETEQNPQSTEALAKNENADQQGNPGKREDQALERALSEADDLQRQIENLQRQFDRFRRGTANGESLNPQEVSGLQEGMDRLRNDARNLSRTRAGRGGWTYDARSIERQLTEQEIADFMTQPELWQDLMSRVQNLKNNLEKQVTVGALRHRFFTATDENIQKPYQKMVETYFRTLSEPFNPDQP